MNYQLLFGTKFSNLSISFPVLLAQAFFGSVTDLLTKIPLQSVSLLPWLTHVSHLFDEQQNSAGSS